MGFQFQSRGKDGCSVRIDKQGYGDDRPSVEIYQSLACLDFNSKRKRVTCVYLREGRVFVMCKGADANVWPLLRTSDPAQHALRESMDARLQDMCTKGLRTLVVASAVRDAEWWFGPGGDGGGGMGERYRATNLPDRGAEKGHHRGECAPDCRICSGLLHIEHSAHLSLLGASAIEDRLQDLVPETIESLLSAGIKVWMLTGDHRRTAKNIALACNLIDPAMERLDLLGSLSVEDLNRCVEVTGDWATLTNDQQQLRQMFDILDCGSANTKRKQSVASSRTD